MGRTTLRWVGCLAVLVACSGSEGTTVENADGTSTGRPKGNNGPALSVEADVGAMNEARVGEAFRSAADGMLDCLGKSKVPAASGIVRVMVHVDQSGKAVKSFLKKSTLGDRRTEECMLGVIRGRSWPAPVGGKIGHAENEFAFDPPSGVRPPVAWSEGDAGKNLGAAKAVLAECSSGGPALSATVIVDTEGNISSVGVAEDENGEGVAACVVTGLASIKLNSPGSVPAKLSFGR